MSFVPSRSLNLGFSKKGLGLVLPVGRRVFVHCPGDPGRRVGLLADDGQDTTVRLADGAEVEILAWRPRHGGGTRYRVAAATDRTEGWLGAEDVRSGASPAAPLAAVPAVAPRRVVRPAVEAGRKFGQRS